MGAELYKADRTFRDDVDGCSEILKLDLGIDLPAALFAEPGADETRRPAICKRPARAAGALRDRVRTGAAMDAMGRAARIDDRP